MRKGFEHPLFHGIKTFIHRQLYQIIGTFTLSAFFTTVNQCFTALTGRPAFTRRVGLNIIMFVNYLFSDLR